MEIWSIFVLSFLEISDLQDFMHVLGLELKILHGCPLFDHLLLSRLRACGSLHLSQSFLHQ